MASDVERLCDLARDFAGGANDTPRQARWLTPYRRRRVEDWISDHLSAKLSVRALAATVGVSTSFLSRAFKAAAGQSIYDYILDRRVARARERIVRTSEGLADIALATGFTSHGHMTTTFRQRLGISPSALRVATWK